MALLLVPPPLLFWAPVILVGFHTGAGGEDGWGIESELLPTLEANKAWIRQKWMPAVQAQGIGWGWQQTANSAMLDWCTDGHCQPFGDGHS
jgi:hypothetical protein